MHRNDIPGDGNQGHWAVAPSSNGVDVLVQIGEIDEARQARPRLAIPVALHLAGDLLAAARFSGPGTFHVGDADDDEGAWHSTGSWFVETRHGTATLTLRDPSRNANEEATLAMPLDTMREMAVAIARVAVDMLTSA